MITYVLTKVEGRRSVPVGVVTSRKIADEWTRMDGENDWFQLELDRLDHLNFPENGAAYTPAPDIHFEVPAVPDISEDTDPVDALRQMQDYLKKLATGMREVEQAIRY